MNTENTNRVKVNYLLTEKIKLEKPQLVEFLDDLEQQVVDFANDEGMNQMELRRLVMGRIGFNELVQRHKSSYFKVKKTAPMNDWNGLVSLAYKEDEDFRIARDPIQVLKRKYASLQDDSLQDNGELREKLDAVKAEKEKEREEKKNKEKVLPRYKMYQDDLNRFLEMADRITKDYNQHLLIVGANESPYEQSTYLRFTHATSGKIPEPKYLLYHIEFTKHFF